MAKSSPSWRCHGSISKRKQIALHGRVATTLSYVALHCATKPALLRLSCHSLPKGQGYQATLLGVPLFAIPCRKMVSSANGVSTQVLGKNFLLGGYNILIVMGALHTKVMTIQRVVHWLFLTCALPRPATTDSKSRIEKWSVWLKRHLRHLIGFIGVATPAEPRGKKKHFFVQILGGEKLLKFGEKCLVKYF